MITVRALRDFHAGPRQSNGARDVAIHAGETRELPVDPGDNGAFYTRTKWGTLSPLFRLGHDHGWERVSPRATGKRPSHPSVPPYVDTPRGETATTPESTRQKGACISIQDTTVVAGLTWMAGAFDGDADAEREGTSRAGEDGGDTGSDSDGGEDEDDWPI